MKNDLVYDFKKSCKKLDDEMRAFYDKADRNGASVGDLNEIADLLNRLIMLQDVDESTLDTGKEVYKDIEREFKTSQDTIKRNLKKNGTIGVNFVKKPNKKLIYAASGVLLLTIVGLGGKAVIDANAANRANNTDKTVDTNTDAQEEGLEGVNELTVVENTEDEYTVSDTTYVDPNLEAGSYGTFLDVTNKEQVEARAQYIFDTYFANRLDTLPDDQKESITVEKIANTIRIMNGQFPLTEDGEAYFDGFAVDNYTVTLVDTLVNSLSNKNQSYVHVPGHLFAVDHSELSEFIKAYDVLYEKLIYGLNTKNDQIIEEAIACLGYRFNHEWYLQGAYNKELLLGAEGDDYRTIVNPHNLDIRVRYLAFIATVEPFNTTALEWHLSEARPVCIEMCDEYGTQETRTVPVNDIHTALETGAWSNIGAKLAGQENDTEVVPWLVQFYQALYQGLETDYQIYLAKNATSYVPQDTKVKTLTRNI